MSQVPCWTPEHLSHILLTIPRPIHSHHSFLGSQCFSHSTHNWIANKSPENSSLVSSGWLFCILSKHWIKFVNMEIKLKLFLALRWWRYCLERDNITSESCRSILWDWKCWEVYSWKHSTQQPLIPIFRLQQVIINWASPSVELHRLTWQKKSRQMTDNRFSSYFL